MLDTGTDAAVIESSLTLARIPDLPLDLLGLIEATLLFTGRRDGSVSMQAVQVELGDRLAMERLATVFFALAQAGALTRCDRDQRGYAFDRYRVNPDGLRQVVHTVSVARHVLNFVMAEEKAGGRIELIATLPESLPLDPETRKVIPSLAASLHRLIVEAETEIVILNPFFERAGFERLASALLAAAGRGVAITIISRELTDPTSVNWQVISGLARRATAQGLEGRFSFYQYQQLEAGRIVLASHAKALLADSKRAYIGSANLTEHGLTRSIEIGMLLEGTQAKLLERVLQAIVGAEATNRVHDF